MLEINHVSRTFGQKRAVDDVSLRIDKGSFVGVIGRSGAGKSTLLRTINRLQDVSSGSISWNGRDVTTLKGQALRDWRASCAMVFQQFNIVGRLDVMTNVLMGRLNHTTQLRSLLKLWTPEDRAIAVSALEQFDMTALASQRAETLSGGQQQRVAIARALVQEPEIVLADEPIASLDPRNTKIVMDGLERLNKHFGITVLCNLHDLDIAKDYCGRLIGMAQGRVVFDGTPDELTESVARELYGLEAHESMTVLPPVAAPAGGLIPVAA
ncbi:MAG: phosphonate transport system ATP-binding [Beijerinckiaceae bacterium]|nr:MAG: phosphonate transport system ATP-binding [Beijerinckiaceae bacterium]